MGGEEVIVDVVSDTVTNMKKMTPMDAMKEANLVIGRKGKYKNLTIDESQDILKKTNDHIFERDIKYDEFGEIIKPDPEDLAGGGIAGMLGERDGYYKGSMAKSRPKKERRSVGPSWMMERMEPRGYRKVYESLEDIPEEALALMKKDPNFDLQTFLETVKWSEPEETRFKKIKKYGKYSEDDIPWGTASPWGQYLNYLPFGEKESIGDGLLSLKTPSDMDKAQTVMHEMRHSKMAEPWFRKSAAVPKWVQEYKGDHYLDKDVKDKHSQYRDTQQDVSGEELYTRFLDQHFYPDAAKKGELAGSDYEPYFDKILKDKWASNLKAYKDILKEEKRVKSKPYGLAGGGKASSGLNYLLGEDDQNSRVPYGAGGMGRRLFLKLMGGAAAGTAAAKSGLFSLLKSGKPAVVKDLTSIPIRSADGMPLWFKPLVNKVIKEGEDVTKKFATVDREIVHQVSLEGKIGKNALGVEDVRVTQNLDDGTIRVQYNSPNTIGESGVELVYKKGEEIPIKKKGKNTSVKEKDEFTAVEDDFYPQTTSPDGDFDLEFTENIVNKVDDLYSDTSKLKEFATGKKRTIKEISESIKKKNYIDEVEKNPNDHAFRNAPDYDGPYEDFASGGRVPFIFGGGAIKNVFKRLKDLRKMPRTEKMMKPDPKVQHLFSEADKLQLAELKLEHAEAMLDMLKGDRQLFLQLQANKAMKDEGLDFLMKKMIEPMAPHMKGYKSLKEIDEAILNMEMIVKNKAMKQGRQVHATGGRVPLAGGGGIMKLLKLFKTKPSTLKEFIDRRKFLQTLILNTGDMKNKRMLQEILEENKKVKGFEFPESGVGSDIHKEIEMILSKDVTKHATGGLAGMLGE